MKISDYLGDSFTNRSITKSPREVSKITDIIKLKLLKIPEIINLNENQVEAN